ncbi:Shedu immune nuclease family protein [Croceivirga radicis]|uniref:Shedu immune nuclease family protein n=1 Tax=Croceivirga radicis TaxID=1929488 RepID=UPI000255B4DC|nr:Shedu immune nuclease family protein [Croceivirga radicis]
MNDERKDRFYALQRALDKIYFSESFKSPFDKRNKRFAHKLLDFEESEYILKDEQRIGVSYNGKRQLKALFFEDHRRVEKLIIQQFGIQDNPIKNSTKETSFRGIEVERLYFFLKGIKEADFPDDSKFNVKDSELARMLLNKTQVSRLVEDNLELLQDALNNNVTTKDLINFGYRKKQLEIFDKLLSNSEFFNEFKTKLEEESGKKVSEEQVWQKFFEKNTWILGYGLDYIFNSELDSKKLEQVTSGSNFNSGGKRTDALLKSLGAINSLCFCELKLSSEPLLKQVKNPYRGESWQISDALAGAIAQVQRTVHKAVKDFSTKTEIKDKQDNLTGETLYFYNPKAFVLIGNLNEFMVDGKINEIKFSSFEMFRKSLKNIEIITYDELYERAFYICHNKE